MNTLKNILVALDLSDIDQDLIRYASYLAEKLPIENVYFVHNIKKYEISTLFEEQLKEVNLDEIIGDELNETIESHFTADVNWEVLISEDPNTESLIEYITQKYVINLTLLGNKRKSKGSGIISGKLLRILKCHILAIPENTKPKLAKVWVGTDFSNASKKAVSLVKTFSEKIDFSVEGANVYTIPVQFSPYVPKETMMNKVAKHAREKTEKFFAKTELHEQLNTFHILPGRDASIAEQLLASGKKNEIDLLAVADKGRNNFSSLLIGSVTEELFSEKPVLPILVAK